MASATTAIPYGPSERTIARILKDGDYGTALSGKWHRGDTAETDPNAHGFGYFYGFHEGCVDYYSHRYCWGEPKRANFHDLWRNRTEIFEDGQYLTEPHRAGSMRVSGAAEAQSVLPLYGLQRGALSDACAAEIC